MIIEVHLYGRKGEGRQVLLDHAVKLTQLDNEMLIQDMVRQGQRVPDTVDELGLEYRPATEAEARQKRVLVRGFQKMLDDGVFACGDAAAWEAAVQSQKYGRRALGYVKEYKRGVEGLYHAVYRMDGRDYDPVARYLRRTGITNPWEAMA